MKKHRKQILFFLVLLAVILNTFAKSPYFKEFSVRPSVLSQGGSDDAFTDVFEKRLSNKQLAGSGKVIKLLPDDNKGRRHQRFILQLASGQTLLISHNIDLAPKIETLKKGSIVEFYGEYEWNDKGGVIHWTHHDPKGRHIGGWLKYNGKLYQ